MTTPSMNDLTMLSATNSEPAISLMQSVQPSNRAWNVTSWKNLLRSAEEDLLKGGMRSEEARGLLAPATALIEESDFWTRSGDSVACFLSKKSHHVFRTPLPLPSLAVVGKHFHLLPFLPAALEDKRFFILALSANHVRLLESTRFESHELELSRPHSLAEAMANHDRDSQGGVRTAHAPGAAGGGGTSVHYGQGAGVDDAKDAQKRYCRMVDDAVCSRLKSESGPLVLAAAEGIASIYRHQNRFPNLLDKGIAGNPDRPSNEELRDGASPIAHEVFDVRRKTAVERCVAAAGRGGLAMDLGEIVSGALAGRVELLLAPMDRPRWGTLDAAGGDLRLHAAREPGDEELTNVAALGALLHRGEVAFTMVDDVPSTIRLPAAILRPGF